jgi:hypothetical protein
MSRNARSQFNPLLRKKVRNGGLRRVFEFLGSKNEKLVEKPSRTASVDFSKGSRLSKWKERLPDMEIKDILWTCNEMDIDFYSKKSTPEYGPW